MASGPGDNGIWNTGESMEAEVRLNRPAWIGVPEGRCTKVEMTIDIGRMKRQ